MRVRTLPVVRGVRVAILAVVVTAVTACQPAGGPPGGALTPAADGDRGPALGAPAAGMPTTLDDLVARAELIAAEWQDETILAEIEVDLDERGAWQSARTMFLAADADRFLALVTAGGGFNQQRPTLSTLQVQPVTAEGITAIPELPPDAAEPQELADGPAAEECGIGVPRTVLYVTGAPVAWDGSAWSRPPEWTATVTSGDAAAAVDVRTAELIRCLE
jgi:hypothetical protein